MQSFLQVLIFSSTVSVLRACAPTDPGTTPGSPGGPALPKCCRDDIFDKALPGMNGRALFNPVLVRCPMSTEFICSVREDLVKEPTMIILNGGPVIATGPDGMNSFVKLTCRDADKLWITPDGKVVNKIGCLNNAA